MKYQKHIVQELLFKNESNKKLESKEEDKENYINRKIRIRS